MKITLISNLYEPYARGGAEVIVKRTAKELAKLGHHVSIITAQPLKGLGSFVVGETLEEKIKVFRFYPPNIFFYANDYKWPLIIRMLWHVLDIFNFHSAWSVQQILEKEKPDLVITHNLMGLGYMVPKAVRRVGIKHIHVLHDIQLAIRSGVMIKGKEQGFGKSGFWASKYQSMVKSLFQSPDVIVSPSNFLLKFYDDYGYFLKSKKIVLRNPVDKKFFSDEKKQMNTEIVFGYVGQLVEHKGLKVLREAFKQIDRQNIHLRIVGDGPMQQEVSDWEKEDKRIDYKGRIPNKYLADFYQSIDMLVLPTLTYENSPTVVLEALASGTPVIVSDIGGAAEMVKDGQTGYIVEAGDVDSLVARMNKFVDDKPDMVSSAIESVKDLHASSYVKKVLDL